MTDLPLKQSLSILVVEDNEIDLRVFISMLTESKNDHFVKTANTLKEALKALNEHEFDVVVLDLNLKDSQGEVTLEELIKNHPKVAIVINTGAYEDDVGIKTLGIGSQDFLVKGKYTPYILNKVLYFAVERKRLASELMETNQRLRETQNQLIQAEKMRVVGGLASGVAHEVKNPLATILYGVTYLNDQLKNPDEKIKHVIESIKEAAERANDIIVDLLDFSCISKLKKETTDLNHLIHKSIQLVEHEFKTHEIQVETKLLENLYPISMDKNKIEQVIVNLLLNAVHAINRKGKICISTEIISYHQACELKLDNMFHYGPAQGFVAIYVDDTGCGIAPEKADKIFEPFFTSRRADGGVGLGLSVSKNIIDMHEGKISLINRSQGGTRAIVLLKA